MEEAQAINFDEPETLEPDTLESETFEPEPFEPETLEPEENLDETEPQVEETKPEEKEKTSVSEAPSECAYHLGYLSERESKDQIPDECMTCKDIVTCMLKKMDT